MRYLVFEAKGDKHVILFGENTPIEVVAEGKSVVAVGRATVHKEMCITCEGQYEGWPPSRGIRDEILIRHTAFTGTIDGLEA